MPNFRYTARGRPHIVQRRFTRVENFAGCFVLAIFDSLATGLTHVRKQNDLQISGISNLKLQI
jgi:hypothetical protein